MAWLSKLIATFRTGRLAADLDDELRFHVEQRAEALTAQGVAPEEARRQASRQFGNRTAYQESTRDSDVLGWLDTTMRDLRFAARRLRRSPGFAAAAILSLALGIGANTGLFSLLDALLLKWLPVKEPQQLVRVLGPSGSLGYPAFNTLRSKSRTMSVAATGRLNVQAVEERGEKLPTVVQEVTGEYFDVLGVGAARGRVFHGADARSPEGPLAVISDRYWRSHYGASDSVLGAVILYRKVPFVVAGVAPPGFRGVLLEMPTDVWVPIEPAEGPKSDLLTRGAWLLAFGRLQSGNTASQASAEASALLQRKIETEPGGNGFSTLRGRFSRPLLVLESIVGLVLLIACANLANLMLAGAAARQQETAVRQALGASRSRLMRQMLTESLLVAFAGAALAMVVATWLSRAMLHFLPPSAAPALVNLEFHLDARVLGFTGGIALLTALLFGLMPAIRATRPSLAPEVKEHGARRGVRWTSRGLVAGEVMLCTVLLMGAGLFVGSLRHLRDLDPGFVAEQMLVADVRSTVPRSMSQTIESMRLQVATLPGVTAVGYSHIRQLSGFSITADIDAEGQVPVAGESKEAEELHISPGFFAAMGTPLLRGRDFSDRDDRAATPVAIVNESFARRFFGGKDAVGRHFGLDGPRSAAAFEIVGVVKDARWFDLRRSAPIMFYRPAGQIGAGVPTLAVRTSGDLKTLATALAGVARQIDPRLILQDVVPFTEMEDRTLAIERMVAEVSAGFGALALVVACIGLYGVLAYSVARRTREIGVRMALGASRRGVEWLILRESLLLLGAGFALGLPLSLACARLVSSMLFGLTPADPATIAASFLVLSGVAVAASLGPARRAARIDPMVALRYE